MLTNLIILSVNFSHSQKRHVADEAATIIGWTGDKIVGSSHTGTISLKSGWLNITDNSISGGEFIVDMKTIKNSDISDQNMRIKLEDHLKSDDFFGVEKFPESRLVITGSSRFTDGMAVVRGRLTIKEATHPVEFTVKESHSNDKTGYTADIIFDRSLYNVRYGSGKFFSNLGNQAINDKIKLNVRLVLD